jgi:hypothetical protein
VKSVQNAGPSAVVPPAANFGPRHRRSSASSSTSSYGSVANPQQPCDPAHAHLPDAIITKAYAPILVIGAIGGAVIGGVIHGWGVRG